MKGVWKGKLKVKKLKKEKMLSARTTQGYRFTKGATLKEGDGSNEESHGRDEGEYEKSESCRRLGSSN